MLGRLSRITTPQFQLKQDFKRLAYHYASPHFSARRIGGRMLTMCGLSAIYLKPSTAVAEIAQHANYYPLAIWGLIKKPYRLATTIGLAVSYPYLADSFAEHLPFFLKQYEFITLVPALLISSGLETARVIWGRICPKGKKEKLDCELSAKLQDYMFSSADIARNLTNLPPRKGNLVFAQSILKGLAETENMAWKAELVLARLEELRQSYKWRTRKRAKRLIKYIRNSEIS